ncbi:MAG: phosphoribosyltransferase [Candidatus Thermoplasmatota archaeon]|nr:phosphoribosyltransferase [Candidatus Thermoplasmatota archaeon]
MEFKATLVTWEEIEKWCKRIFEKVSSNYKPDAIVALSRGGLIPGRILSDLLLVKDLYAVKTEHWGITASLDGKAKLQDSGILNINGKRILVVDDITDTGESMLLALKHLQSMNPVEIKTATMLHIDHSKYTPDFFAEPISKDNWAWFVFPWNITEDIYNLIMKTPLRTGTSPEFLSELQERFSLEINEESLKRYLGVLSGTGKIRYDDETWLIE